MFAQQLADRIHLTPALQLCLGELVCVAAVGAVDARAGQHQQIVAAGYGRRPGVARRDRLRVRLVKDDPMDVETGMGFLDASQPAQHAAHGRRLNVLAAVGLQPQPVRHIAVAGRVHELPGADRTPTGLVFDDRRRYPPAFGRRRDEQRVQERTDPHLDHHPVQLQFQDLGVEDVVTARSHGVAFTKPLDRFPGQPGNDPLLAGPVVQRMPDVHEACGRHAAEESAGLDQGDLGPQPRRGHCREHARATAADHTHDAVPGDRDIPRRLANCTRRRLRALGVDAQRRRHGQRGGL